MTFASISVLRVRDVLHPVDRLAVERLLNGDMGHRGGRRRAVPVLLAGAKRPHRPGWISSIGPPSRCALPQPAVTISICPSGWVCHAVRAPGSNVTALPPRAPARNRKQRVDPHRAGEPIRRPFAGRLRTGSFDFHPRFLFSIECFRRGSSARLLVEECPIYSMDVRLVDHFSVHSQARRPRC